MHLSLGFDSRQIGKESTVRYGLDLHHGKNKLLDLQHQFESGPIPEADTVQHCTDEGDVASTIDHPTVQQVSSYWPSKLPKAIGRNEFCLKFRFGYAYSEYIGEAP